MKRKSWKSLARKALNHLPDNGQSVKSAFRLAKLWRFKFLMKLRRFSNDKAIPDSETIYWIDPARIEDCTADDKDIHGTEKNSSDSHPMQDLGEQVFDRVKYKGKTCAGDWDKSTCRFDELEVYKALEEHILRDVKWEQTNFYQTIAASINQGEVFWGCDTEAEFRERCEYLDRLVSSVRKQGYKLNSEVVIEGDDPQALAKHKEIGSEVLVNIGRDGDYLFQDGRHRLAIAKILGIEIIPVKVLIRHKKWQELREYLSAMVENSAGASKKGVLYQSAIHPDLSDFPATHACENRFNIMREHLAGHSGNLLDVGANLGYFCHRCEDLGFDCYAIELLPEVAWAADRIRKAEKKKFQIIQGDLITAFEREPLKGVEFDTVIVLNILHHFLITKDRYEQLRTWLQNLKVKTMFFEAHRTDEDHMVNTYANLDAEDFVAFLLENTLLTKAEFLSSADDGRKMYKLSQ